MAARRLLASMSMVVALAPPALGDGLPIGPVTAEAQSQPAVTSDGRGGALVTYKTASLKVGAVHVSGAGLPDGGIGFAPAWLPFALEASEPVRLSLPSDTQIVLVSDRATSSSPVLTSMRAGGSATAGFPVGLAMPH